MKQFKTYKDAVENIKIGDHIFFNKKNSFLKENGEVVDRNLLDDRFYLTIYSFYKRERIKYILNENLELVKPGEKKNKNREILNLNYFDNEQNGHFVIKKIFMKTVSVITILSFILLYYPHTFFLLISPKISYENF